MSIGKRIVLFLKKKGVNQKEAAELLKVTPTTISNWKKENSTIYLDKIQSIADLYEDINLNWLITGKGEMLLKDDGILNESTIEYNSKIRELELKNKFQGEHIKLMENLLEKIKPIIDAMAENEKKPG